MVDGAKFNSYYGGSHSKKSIIKNDYWKKIYIFETELKLKISKIEHAITS